MTRLTICIALATLALAACDQSAPSGIAPTAAPSFARGGGAANNGRIVFSSNRDAAPGSADDVYSMNPDGTAVTRLTTDPAEDIQPSLSPDGKRIVFVSARANPAGSIYVMNVDGTGVARLTS